VSVSLAEAMVVFTRRYQEYENQAYVTRDAAAHSKDMGVMRNYPAWQRYGMAAVFAYEAVALVTRNDKRVPTITYLQCKGKPGHAMGAALVVYLGVHFVRADRTPR